MSQQLALFRDSLPKKPYCSDDLDAGLLIRNVDHAVTMRYIQPNHPNSKLWLLFDIDRATGPEEITDDLNLPAPTFFVQNPANQHAHALYALETPVHLNPESSIKAMRFAGAVDAAFSSALDADAAYTGLICKNPANEHWRTYALGDRYDLSDLSEYVELGKQDRRKRLPEVGLGRNVNAFDRLRIWAYRAIRQGWPNLRQWQAACLDRCVAYNTQIDVPLDFKEVQGIAKSVSKWTYKHMSATGFSAVQSARGRRGGLAKGAANENKRASARLMASNGLNHTQIAFKLGVHRNTIRNWVNEN